MKKLTVIFIFLFAVVSVFGQGKSQRTTAFNYLRKGQLDKALENIEPTTTDPTTMNDPKTWFYRGNIYLQIHMSDKPEYKSLDPDALTKAYDSYQKMMELDTKKEYYADAIQNLLVISEQLYNQGVEAFTKAADPAITDKSKANELYGVSLQNFEKAAKVAQSFGNVDTLAIFNAALAAQNGQNYQKATEHFNRLIELNFPKPLIYSSLASVYLNSQDTTKAFEIISKGRQKYPQDFDLLIAETNLYLGSRNTEKAMTNLQEAIKTDPLNPTIHYAAGTIYDQMGNKDDAEKSYIKAIELNPEYFEANYNLGALYVNKAAEIQNEANKLKLGDPKYDEMKAQADDILRKSLPYLEKATVLVATDKSTLLALKEIYTRLGMYDKLKEVNSRLADL
ncbi:MAG TPA: tetratricopeptide repeat protein [Lentimicrobium sp.]|nr:tetratricopeptide repeat protein [Lentimicrobium sp.]